jgi:ABC-type bacteriocin/lantibiotic exporter with double-glycine peptidase domain
MNQAQKPAGWWREIRALIHALSRFLTPRHKRQLLWVSLWACALSALEMLVAAAVVPYVNCLNDQCPKPLTALMTAVGGPQVPLLSLALFLLITIKLAAQAILTWRTAEFNQQVQRDTVCGLLEGYLHLDWLAFRSENRTHYFRRCATTAVDAAWVGQQCVVMISSTLLLLFLVGLMLWQYPVASLCLAAGFLLLNLLTQRLLGQSQKRAAQQREAALQRWSISMAEAFASFREVRVYGLERFFLDHLAHAIDRLASANRQLGVYPALPRLILDFAVLGILLLVVAVWTLLQRPLAELLPQLIFYAVVARIMLPAMMNLLSTRAVLFGSIYNIELVLEELQRSDAHRRERIGVDVEMAARPAFVLDHVGFQHAPGQPAVIAEASLRIEHPSWLAVVGPSGAGKSTLMELLCGILVPQQGSVRHDWPDLPAPRIAYLPQHVALLDDSIEHNVVFGFDQGDVTRVDQALQLACLDEVVGALPGGRLAAAGADGARLSGGERQRLALARALYRNPDLLLLDEATSGLDETTETRLFERLRHARPEMTVVYITHRSGNLRFADRTVRVHNGNIEELDPQGMP